MQYIKEYSEFRRLKKYLRDKNILKPLKYKEGDLIVLNNGREAIIYKINKYKVNPEDYIGNYRKDYLIKYAEDDGWYPKMPWDISVDENEIDQEKSEFLQNTTNYNL